MRRSTQPASAARIATDGKFLRVGDERFLVKGVTYGPFAPNRNGELFPDPEQARADFELIRTLGANCVRVYHLTPKWFLDLAQEMGLKINLSA